MNDFIAKTITSKTKRTFSYDVNFEQILIDNDIYSNDYDFPDDRDSSRSNNENEILVRLKQSRSSLSPSQFSEKVFRIFKQINSRALHEDDVMSTVFSVIQGDAHFSSARNMIFNNLKSLIDDNVVDVKPDFYDEASSAQIDRRIRAELGSYITSSTQQQASALLNFFTEVKSSDESEAVTKRQACYDGVVGARDMRKLATFEMKNSETIYDNNAYTITSTYHSVIGTLQMYTIHSTKSIKSIKPIKSIKSIDSESSLEYNMTQLEGWALTEFRETFLQGTGVFRNARDLAKAQRDGFIATANGRVIGMLRETFTLESSDHSILSQSTNEPTALESETSADELAQDRSEGPSLSHRRLKRGSVKSNLQRDSNKRLKRTTRKQDSDG